MEFYIVLAICLVGNIVSYFYYKNHYAKIWYVKISATVTAAAIAAALFLFMPFSYISVVIVLILASVIVVFNIKLFNQIENFVKNINSIINHIKSNSSEEMQIVKSNEKFIEYIETELEHLLSNQLKQKDVEMDILSNLTSTSVQLQATVEEQSVSLVEQSSSLNETASTIKELGITADQTTEKATMVVQSADKSMDISKRGHEAFKRSVNSMLDIRAKVERIAVQILELSSHTQKIGSIISTVDDIAETTNLLALNASIEASKAGEFGKGFQVIALEIRKLAIQSQRAVAEIAEIITEIQNATNSTVMATEEGTKGVDIGVDLITKAGNLMEESISSLDDNLNAAHQILAANKQQTIGIDQITQAVNQVNEVIKQISLGINETKEAVVTLKRISQSLKEK